MYKKKFKEHGLPCPCGKSSDAFAVDFKGEGYCFSCSKPFGGEKDIAYKEKEYKVEEFEYYPDRGISRGVFEFFDVKTRFLDGEPTEVGFVWPNGGVRVRRLGEDIAKADRFYSKGNMTNPGLFGQDKFDPGSKDGVVIVAGGHDVLSVYEMTQGKFAVVSPTSESVAKRDCANAWNYLNSFKKIYLCFDNDEQGRKAAADVAPLFDFHKVYHVKLTVHKDPNEYLVKQDVDSFRKVLENAKRFSPDNIISSFTDIRDALRKDSESQIGTYPFEILQTNTYGLHEGEIVVIKARRGVGKSELLRAIEYHLLKSTKINLGLIHLEEDTGTTIKALAGYELSVPATLPDCGLSEDDIFEGYRKAVSDDEGRVHLYLSFDREDEELLFNNIRFLVAAAGCKVIVLDHITWLATGKDDQDERKKLDRISQGLKLLAKELRCCIIVVSHINAQGGTRGSANIENSANTIIFLDRDEKNPDQLTRSLTNIMLEKVRLGGRTGPAGRSIFNQMTGKLEEFSDQSLVNQTQVAAPLDFGI